MFIIQSRLIDFQVHEMILGTINNIVIFGGEGVEGLPNGNNLKQM